MSGVDMIVDGAHGIYVPQVFAQKFDLTEWKGIDPSDIEILAAGPDHGQYWDAWDEILMNASIDRDGRTWHLVQDGDLFMYCAELMTDEEYENFFDSPRE